MNTKIMFKNNAFALYFNYKCIYCFKNITSLTVILWTALKDNRWAMTQKIIVQLNFKKIIRKGKYAT